MANLGGNYPGRQIFLGTLKTGEPAFAYFGSGRSPASQGRYASLFDEREKSIRIKPVDPNEEFDPFRHYQAVRIDPKTGLLVVSNSQAPVDAVFEAYKFMDDSEKIGNWYLGRILQVIGPEYDSKEKPTPRIVGVVYPQSDSFGFTLGITTEGGLTTQKIYDSHYNAAYERPWNEKFERNYGRTCNQGILPWVSTYNGDVEYKDMDLLLFSLDRTYIETNATTPQQLADEIYEMSDYVDPKYGELRVWCVAGVRNGNGPCGWEITRRNRHVIE